MSAEYAAASCQRLNDADMPVRHRGRIYLHTHVFLVIVQVITQTPWRPARSNTLAPLGRRKAISPIRILLRSPDRSAPRAALEHSMRSGPPLRAPPPPQDR